MQKLLTIVLLLSAISGTAFSQTKALKTIIVDEKVEITVPASFSAPVYAANNRWQFLNADQKIQLTYELIAVNPADTTGDNDIPAWADKQLSILRNNSRAVYLDDGIFLQEGKNIGYIKYKLHYQDSISTYNQLFFMAVDGRIARFHFSSPLEYRKNWEPIADRVANSVRISPK